MPEMLKTRKPIITKTRKPIEMPPAETEVRDNLKKPDPIQNVGLNFLVSTEFKREFKMMAADLGLKQVELLKRCFEAYKEQLGHSKNI